MGLHLGSRGFRVTMTAIAPMDENRAAAGSTRIDQIRTILFGDRVDVLERRIEILARNLGKEVEAARNELLRRFEPIERRLDELDAARAEEVNALRTELEGHLTDGLAAERDHQDARRERLESELQSHVEDRTARVSGELRDAISAAVTAREALGSKLRSELERTRSEGQAGLEALEQALRTELVRLRADAADAQELSRMFADLARRLNEPRSGADGDTP